MRLRDRLPERRQLLLVSAAVFLGALYHFLKAASPGLMPGDSAETTAMCLTLGVGHPSGYPLFALLGRSFSLLPLGGSAIRVNFFAATLAALCAALTLAHAWAWSLRDGANGALAGLTVLGIFLCSHLFWEQAVAAKGGLYCLNLSFSLGILLCLLQAGDQRRLRLAALLFGLGLAGHFLMQVALAPVYGLLLLSPGGRARLQGRQVLACLAWVLPGLSLWAYLPIRSHFEPWLNWSDISSAADLWRHVFRAQYVALETHAGHIQIWLRLSDELTGLCEPWGWGLGCLALAGAWISRRTAGLPLLAMVVLLPWVCVYHLDANVEQQYLHIYEMPSRVAALLLIAPLFWRLPRSFGQAWLPAILIAVILGPLCAGLRQVHDRSTHYELDDHIRELTQMLPYRSVVLATEDTTCFSLWYVQALGQRRDLTVLPVLMSTTPWLRAQMRVRQPWVAQPPVGSVDPSAAEAIAGFLRLNVGRLPVFCGSHDVSTMGTLGYRYAPWGPLWAVLPPGPALRMKHPEKLRSLLMTAYDRSPVILNGLSTGGTDRLQALSQSQALLDAAASTR